MDTYEQGDSITFTTTVQAKTPDPFGTAANTNPDNGVTITITDPNGVVAVSAAAMSNSATGKYYYTYATTTSSPTGLWEYKIVADGTTYDSVHCDRFRLRTC